ncbi:hypothetical protein BGZ97_006802, partial [Linnemannia gamsii]
MSLDLTVPWNTSAPAWAKLADGPTQEVFPMAFSSDQQILYAFNIPGTNSPWQYNVKNDSWQVSTASFDDAKFKGFQAVTDPRSGYIYIAGGYHHHNFYAPYMKTLDIFDPVTQTIHSVDLPAPEQAFPVRWYYGAVWSKYRNTDERGSTCHEDGTKIYIYGGSLPDNTVVGELWMLDVVTKTWSQRQSGPVRMDAVCTVAGDQLLVWGGAPSWFTMGISEMTIYNFNTSTYVSQFQKEGEDEDSVKTKREVPSELSSDQAERGGGGTNGVDATERGLWKGPKDGAFESDPQGTRQDYTDADMTLQELVNQQQDLEQKRQLLMLMQQGLTMDAASSILESSQQFRGPAAVSGDQSDYYLPPPPPSMPTPTQPLGRPMRNSPGYSNSESLTGDVVSKRPTVQAMPGLVVYESDGADGYADGYVGARLLDDVRRESDLTQETIEPTYGTSPTVNNAIPDLVYAASPDVGMGWTRQQKDNHPHSLVDLPRNG